ncbi:MAG: PhoH family protein [Sphingobacterium sp.]|nr:PhoH family protein [Sphingobacterium sp.]
MDLPHPKDSGVLHALKILAPIKEIAICKFDDRDVVRHPLVQKIVKAYQKAETRDSD